MKKMMMLAAVATLATGMMFAQGRGGHGGPGPNNGTTTTDPATLIANKVAFLKSLLTLSDAQAASATTIFTNELAAETTARASLDTAETSLQAAIKSNSTTQIDTLAAQIGTIHGQLTAIDAKADAAFYALLTADQKTKYDTLNQGHAGGPGR